jgi:6-phosphogluconolactonase/glucosamine-6-phosphate isomerase/deaminase
MARTTVYRWLASFVDILELPLRDACVDYFQKLPQSLDVCLLGVGEDGHTAP